MQTLNEIFMASDVLVRATVAEVVTAVAVSFFLGLVITYTYMKTYTGPYYSKSFVQTLIIVQVVISIIIVAIGSNIARAFSLAGALSIIRFRTAIGDPRDIAFIFFVMGAGLAVGAGLILPAIAFVLLLSGLIGALHAMNYGEKKGTHKTLKITVPENLNYEGLFDDILDEYLMEYRLLSVRTTNLGTMFELVYAIKSLDQHRDKQLIDDVRTRNGNLNVAVILDRQSMD